MGTKRTLGAVGAVVAVLAWGEWASRRASQADLGSSPQDDGDEAIIVLGFPARANGRPGRIQRYRTDIAVRSRTQKPGVRSTLIFTGRSPHRPGARSEAAVMADDAVRRCGVDPADVLLEEDATTTWQNIHNVLPLLEGYPVVKIASDTFPARKARRFVHRQAPEVAARLRRAGDHRRGELLWLKPALAVLGLIAGRGMPAWGLTDK